MTHICLTDVFCWLESPYRSVPRSILQPRLKDDQPIRRYFYVMDSIDNYFRRHGYFRPRAICWFKGSNTTAAIAIAAEYINNDRS